MLNILWYIGQQILQRKDTQWKPRLSQEKGPVNEVRLAFEPMS